ncbi:hypothetical protein WJX82_008661 [Trebouxia sp. C0006]
MTLSGTMRPMDSSCLRTTSAVPSRALSSCHGLHPRLAIASSSRSSNSTRRVTSMAGHGKFFVGGNWKCNGDKHGVKKLIDDLNAADVPEDIDIIVAPTFIHLEQVQGALKKPYQLGAQNCWVGKGGAFTGEISAEQLHDIGVPWVIVGHSERRLFMDETNDFVGHKAAYALSQDLSVIACIGETLHERQAGQLEEVLTKQLTAIGDNIADWDNVVIAYEPVWAIGTGKVATPEQAQDVHKFIRTWFTDKVGTEVAEAMRIIYGGSVNDQNAGELARKEDLDGFLVGGASLKGKTFAKICTSGAKTAAKVLA